MSGVLPGAGRGDTEYLLGVEGGGTTTQAVVADLNGRVLGRGLGPASNHRKVGWVAAVEALSTAIGGALGQVAGYRSGDGPAWTRVRVAHACLGLAGIDTPQDRDMVRGWIVREGIASRVLVVNDAELVLVGGTPEGWGVGLVSGTGSICLARTQDGRGARIGGWGHVFGDEGSGYQIAISALRLASHTADGRADASGLLRGLLSYWRLGSAEELIRHVYRPEVTASEISQLAIGVQELATRGDADAAAIVEQAAKALALHVDTAVKSLGMHKPPLALGGASLRSSLKKSLLAQISVEIGGVTVVQDAVQAAVTIARRELQDGNGASKLTAAMA